MAGVKSSPSDPMGVGGLLGESIANCQHMAARLPSCRAMPAGSYGWRTCATESRAASGKRHSTALRDAARHDTFLRRFRSLRSGEPAASASPIKCRAGCRAILVVLAGCAWRSSCPRGTNFRLCVLGSCLKGSRTPGNIWPRPAISTCGFRRRLPRFRRTRSSPPNSCHHHSRPPCA